MWAMCSFGILMPAIRPPHTVAAGDDRTMQIRTRRAKDLDILRAQYMQSTLGPTIHTPDKDYEYRAYCTPHAFALAMAQIVVEIDYLKFKPTTEAKYKDRELHDCYNGIWGVVMGRLSTARHRWEYWHPQHSAGTAKKATGRATPNAGKAGSGALTRRDWSDWRPDNTGWADWPDAAGYDSGFGYGSSYRYSGGSAADGTGAHGSAGWRNTRADRDAYLPDPALAGLAEDDDAEERWVSAGMDDVDSLYAEIERLLKESDPVEHDDCAHADSDSAKARCRRKQRRAARRKADELRERIDALNDTYNADTYISDAEPDTGHGTANAGTGNDAPAGGRSIVDVELPALTGDVVGPAK